jgi:hypothetical protein
MDRLEPFHFAYAGHRGDACQLELHCVTWKTAMFPRLGSMRFGAFVEALGVYRWQVRGPVLQCGRRRANPRPPMAVAALAGGG